MNATRAQVPTIAAHPKMSGSYFTTGSATSGTNVYSINGSKSSHGPFFPLTKKDDRKTESPRRRPLCEPPHPVGGDPDPAPLGLGERSDSANLERLTFAISLRRLAVPSVWRSPPSDDVRGTPACNSPTSISIYVRGRRSSTRSRSSAARLSTGSEAGASKSLSSC